MMKFMRIEEYHLGFAGFGHMAQIICRSLSAAKLIPRSQMLFHRRDPGKARENEQEFGITSSSLEKLIYGSDLLLLCVRPNQAEFLLRDLSRLKAGDKPIISIMAGVKISFIQKYLDPKTQIARIMPNIASEICEGMSLLSFGPQPSLEFRGAVSFLFGALGQTVEIPEKQMDIGCAMAGSGPGFVLELIEAMARLGEKEGLAYNKALKIAAQTFLGAAALVKNGALPQELLGKIATPGGTTQAGLDEMGRTNISEHFESALRAASFRSKQFSEEFF